MKTTKTTTKAAPKSASFTNPFRVGSNYHAIIATLETLAKNQTTKYATFARHLEKAWDGWKEFANRKSQNKNGLDASGKLLQNVKVLQRSDYGAPLHEQNACIDLGRNADGELTIMLNTKSSKPQSAGRAPKAEKKPTVKVVKATAKATTVKAQSKPPILSGRDALAALKSKK